MSPRLFESKHVFGMPWPRRLPARHGSGAASICILGCRKQPREAPLHSKSCMQGFPVTSGAFVRNNSTLRQCRKLHWLPYFPVKRFAHKRPVIVRPNVFPRFLRAWTKNAPLAIRLCQCFGGCCKANVFRFAEQKQRCKRLQGSKILEKEDRLSPSDREGTPDDAHEHHSWLGASRSSITRFSKRPAPPPSILR
jgi:hypothetical protein